MKHALLLCTALLAALASAAIDEATAANVALKDAHIKVVRPRALYVAPEMEDGRLIYKVLFHNGKTAYTYEISAEDGAILDVESEALPTLPNATEATGDIGKERAKAIAVADARLEKGARRIKVAREHEDGVLVYEVEFRSGKMEYDYRIDAASGKILKREAEEADGLF